MRAAALAAASSILIAIIILQLAGCESLGLSDRNDGTRQFWERLERQSGGGSGP